MYHAITAKDYKPLQKLPAFGVRLLLHTVGKEVSPCGQAVPGVPRSRCLQVKIGSEMRRVECGSGFSPEAQARACRGDTLLLPAAGRAGSEAAGAGGSVFPSPRWAEAGTGFSKAKQAAMAAWNAARAGKVAAGAG